MIKLCLTLLTLFSVQLALASELDKFDELVHVIKVKKENKSSDKSRGSGFVVGRNGRLVTNYHVISHLFKKGKVNEKYRVFVRVKGKDYSAKVLKISILSDLALLEIPVHFKSVVNINSKPLVKGERVYALGFHEKEYMAINRGTFNDYLKGDSNELMALSVPLNGGMSGGPILNRAFQVIGVNVLKNRRKEQAGYGINGMVLAKFLGSAAESDSLETVLGNQINKTYKRVIASFNTIGKTHNLNNWEVSNLEHFLWCTEYDEEYNPDTDKEDENKNSINIQTKVCGLDYRKVPLSAMGTAVKVNYSIANIVGSENTNQSTYYNYINNEFKFQNFRSIFKEGDYSCKREIVKNTHDVSFRVSICAHRYEKLPTYIKSDNYFKFDIKAATLNSEMDDLILILQFSGEPAVVKNVLKTIFGNIKKKKGRGLAGE